MGETTNSKTKRVWTKKGQAGKETNQKKSCHGSKRPFQKHMAGQKIYIRKTYKYDLFSEEDLNKTLKGVLTNELSFRKASKVYRIPIGTLHRYKKKMHPGNIEVKKTSMSTAQVSKFLLG